MHAKLVSKAKVFYHVLNFYLVFREGYLIKLKFVWILNTVINLYWKLQENKKNVNLFLVIRVSSW